MTETKAQSNQPADEVELLSRKILDSLALEIAVLDENGKIIAVNRAWHDFALANGGTAERTGVGVNYLDVCRSSDGADAVIGRAVCCGIEQVLKGTQSEFRFEYPCHSEDQERWFLLYVNRLDSSEPKVVLTHLNITERKWTEQRLVTAERLAAIGEAMQGLSHEGRNALQRSQAHIGLLRLHLQGNPDALDLLDRIQNAQSKMLGLYEEVKNYAAPINLNRMPHRLDHLIEKVWSKIGPTSPLAKLSIAGDATDRTIKIDGQAMDQVLTEIFKNALAAGPRPPEIEVYCMDDELHGLPAITLIVSDNGTGLPEADWKNAFQPFFTTKTHGTGLGLALCKRIVAAHQGLIWSGTPRLSGASLYITLPVNPVS